MPGISLIKSRELTNRHLDSIEEYQSSLKQILPHISCEILFHNDDTIIHQTTYRNYEFYYQQSGNWLITFEGRKDDVDFGSMVESLNLFYSRDISTKAMQEWRDKTFKLCKTDFFFLACNLETGTVVFANDDLARMPVYFFHQKGTFIISREYPLVRNLNKELIPDRLLLALYLLFKYIPGQGTPYEEIRTLDNSSIGVYYPASDSLTLISDISRRMPLESFNGDRKQRLNDLKDSFVSATDECLGDRRGLLAFSGGHDSRCVAAALKLTQKPFISATFVNDDISSRNDMKCARQLAEILNMEHKVLNLAPEDETHYRSLYTLKNGLNFMSVAFMLNFLQELRKEFDDDYVLFTGDGGDRIMQPLYPSKLKLKEDNILPYLFAKQALFDKEYVAHLFDITSAEIDNYLINLLHSYPVSDWTNKYLFFILAENAGKWSFEGEDRNSYYYPTKTPFYNLDFYKLAVSIPLSWKDNGVFYWQFMETLNPDILKVPIAGNKLSPDTWNYLLLKRIKNFLRNFSFLINLKKLIAKPQPTSVSTINLVQQRIEILSKDKNIKEFIPNFNINEFYNKNNEFSRAHFTNLYTVLTMITDQC